MDDCIFRTNSERTTDNTKEGTLVTESQASVVMSVRDIFSKMGATQNPTESLKSHCIDKAANLDLS